MDEEAVAQCQAQLQQVTCNEALGETMGCEPLPPPPEELAGAPIQIDYVSPVARAQRASEAQSIVQLFTVGANLSQVDQGVLDVLDGDAAMRELAEAFGTPPTVIRSRRDVAARREAAAQEAAEAAEMQQAAQGAAVAKDVAAAGKDAAQAGTIQ